MMVRIRHVFWKFFTALVLLTVISLLPFKENENQNNSKVPDIIRDYSTAKSRGMVNGVSGIVAPADTSDIEDVEINEPMKLFQVQDGVDGAICLDGTTPGIYFRKGQGKELKNWIIHLQKGYFCINEADCLGESLSGSKQASSLHLPKFLPPEESQGILSPYRKHNPYFYKWNMAFLPYCDGGAFGSDKDEPLIAEDGKSIAYLRGRRIVQNAFLFLKHKGLDSASNVLISGCGPSSLGVLLNAEIAEKHFTNVKFHYLLDGGLQVTPNIGDERINENIFHLHQLKESSLMKVCLSKINATERTCLYSYNILKSFKQSVFVLTSLYDPWQLVRFGYVKCNSDNCLDIPLNNGDLKGINIFRDKTRIALNKIKRYRNIHSYETSCLLECITQSDKTWNVLSVNKTTPSEAVYKWIKQESKIRNYEDCSDLQCNQHCSKYDSQQ